MSCLIPMLSQTRLMFHGRKCEPLKNQYLSWDKLSSAGCPLSLSNQNPQCSICCLLFSLLLVGRTHRGEPASAQLGLVGEPEQGQRKKVIRGGLTGHSLNLRTTDPMETFKGKKHKYPFEHFPQRVSAAKTTEVQRNLVKRSLMFQNFKLLHKIEFS